MANLLLFFALILAVILTFLETVTVRFTYTDEVFLGFDFLIFKLLLYPSRKKKDKKAKKKPIMGFKARLGRARAIRDTVDYAFMHSDVTVHELNLRIDEDDPAKFVLISQRKSTLLALLIAYAALEIQSLKIEDDIFELPHRIEILPAPVIDVTIKSTLYNTIIAYLIYSTKMKKARRRGYAAVRK